MVLPRDNPAPLSVHRAFVVQLQADTAVERGCLAGRVEHVVSGRATDFQSLETLLAFFAQVLRAEHARPTAPQA
jgi:hypothetical protein